MPTRAGHLLWLWWSAIFMKDELIIHVSRVCVSRSLSTDLADVYIGETKALTTCWWTEVSRESLCVSLDDSKLYEINLDKTVIPNSFCLVFFLSSGSLTDRCFVDILNNTLITLIFTGCWQVLLVMLTLNNKHLRWKKNIYITEYYSMAYCLIY